MAYNRNTPQLRTLVLRLGYYSSEACTIFALHVCQESRVQSVASATSALKLQVRTGSTMDLTVKQPTLCFAFEHSTEVVQSPLIPLSIRSDASDICTPTSMGICRIRNAVAGKEEWLLRRDRLLNVEVFGFLRKDTG